MIDTLLGNRGGPIAAALDRASDFLESHDTEGLLSYVGQSISSIPQANHFDNAFIQKSSRKSDDHFLTGKGLFFITESGKLMLDATAGHYQMPWGYLPKAITDVVVEGMNKGITWDCHSDIPGNPVKALGRQLVAAANRMDSMDDPRLDELAERNDVLNRVIMSACTGTVACAAAFRMAYLYYRKHKSDAGVPVFVTFINNYHGTDTFAQQMRGMWPEMFDKNAVVFEQVEPNNISQMEAVFRKYGRRVACFFFEPIMMNNEAILIRDDTVKEMRRLTAEADAMLVVDEIQSCFFVPEQMVFHRYGIIPDAVVVGKGMTAGFHGQAAVVYRMKYDVLEQFDALSTNGNAPLACLAALACIAGIRKDKDRIRRIEEGFFGELSRVAGEFPGLVECVTGQGLLAGLRFHDRNKAIETRMRLLEQGIWLRVHAYKEGHRTLLMKFALILEEKVMYYFFQRLRSVLREMC